MQKTIGIILHTTAYKDKDLIAKIYTKNFGIISFIIQNVKSAKAKFKSSFFLPLTVLELSFDNINTKSLQKITDANLHYQSQNIFSSIQKSSILYFINEVLYKSIKEEEENQEMFKFIYNKIIELDESETIYFFTIQFLIDLSKQLGFYPNHNYQNNAYFDMLNGVFISNYPSHPYFLNVLESKILSKLLENDFSIELSRIQRNVMVNKLLEFYSLHIENFGTIKSIKVLNEVFE